MTIVPPLRPATVIEAAPRRCDRCGNDITPLVDAGYEGGYRAGYEKGIAPITTWERDWRVHPGEILTELLRERKMMQATLARAAGLDATLINRIIHGQAITAPIAVALQLALGRPSAELWMGLQVGYDLHEARRAAA